MIGALLDHLWQSTLLAGGLGLLTLVFRRNGAGIRFWLWFAASLKFLFPFAALAALGEALSRLYPAALPLTLRAIQPAAEKLSAPAKMLAVPHTPDLVPLLLLVWGLGLVALLGLRLVRALRLRAVLVDSHDLPLPAPVRVKVSASLLEPGLVGILRPVVLLPAPLMAHLSQPERDAILAHELGHLRRGDNLTAAIHMVVETLFWFYPPVWLIGARLIAEREQACDESVLLSGHDPEVYAGSILKVCKFCIQSPLACAPGASGADLQGRVRQIMTGEIALAITPAKRLLLAGAAMLALCLPVMVGFADSPLAVAVQKNVASVGARMTARFTHHVAAMEQQIGIAPVQVQARPLPRLKILPVATLAPELPPAEFALVQPAAPSVTPSPLPAERPAPSPPAAVSGLKQTVLALYPSGTGDPDAITCRTPQALPGSRLPGPEVCKTNRIWAELRAQGQDISADGRSLIAMVQRFGTQARICTPGEIQFYPGNSPPSASALSACR